MLTLPRLDRFTALVDSARMATQAFHTWWQNVVDKIETQETLQDETIARLKRVLSHTDPTTILKSIESGGSCSIQVLDHTRIYADATTLAITGATQTGFTPDTWYAGYYDDTTLSDTTPTFVFTTVVKDAQAIVAEGRHSLGMIQTGLPASGETIESGGVYPMGAASIGGELF